MKTITNFSRNELVEWGMKRNTSPEIVNAIFNYRKTEKSRQRVWQNPTEKEIRIIEKMAWTFADTDEEQIYWGETTVRR